MLSHGVSCASSVVSLLACLTPPAFAQNPVDAPSSEKQPLFGADRRRLLQLDAHGRDLAVARSKTARRARRPRRRSRPPAGNRPAVETEQGPEARVAGGFLLTGQGMGGRAMDYAEQFMRRMIRIMRDGSPVPPDMIQFIACFHRSAYRRPPSGGRSLQD